MGLDITAYRGLRKTEAFDDAPLNDGAVPHPDDCLWVDDGVLVWQEKAFPGRAEGIEPGAIYTATDRGGFRAGSYSSYDAWRAELARRVKHRVHDASGPFYELIEFADNEGYIGPVVAAKLARDFAEHEAAVTAKAKPDFVRRYRGWRKVFEMAADGGAVEFH
jgi:hypothetical protein